jgi:hypothetical protein
MKQGVKYDRSLGFKLDAETDLEGALLTLKSALGEEVELNLRCLVCGAGACPGCRYSTFCDRARVSSLCLCAKHSDGPGAFEGYQRAYAETLVS